MGQSGFAAGRQNLGNGRPFNNENIRALAGNQRISCARKCARRIYRLGRGQLGADEFILGFFAIKVEQAQEEPQEAPIRTDAPAEGADA